MAAARDADMALVDLGDSGKGAESRATETTNLDDGRPENPPPYPGNAAPYPISQQQPLGAYPQTLGYPPSYAPNNSPYPGHRGYEQTIHTAQPRTVTLAPVIAVSCLGPAPVRMQCPYCFQMITTMPMTSPSFAAYMSCMLMFIFLMWLCCWIPFLMEGCRTTKHFCPNCKHLIGVYNP